MIPFASRWKPAASALALVSAAGLLPGCSSSSPTEPSQPVAGDPNLVGSGVIAVGPGTVNTTFTSTTTASQVIASTTGRDLALTIEQLTAAAGTCDSRCPSLDWSDGTTSFTNRLIVTTNAGPRTYFLTRDIGLADAPDPPDPNSTFIEVGGASPNWLSIPLPTDVTPGSTVRLEVTFTHQGSTAVNVSWRLRIV